MLEGLKEALQYVVGLGNSSEKVQVVEICGETYANRRLEAIMKFAGNVEKKNEPTYSDDGRTQVATMNVGVASKADVIVPNPVELIPFRTFQEVKQPRSQFVFRISDKGAPAFKIVEAEGGIWKNEAVQNIKEYFENELGDAPKEILEHITIIG